MIKFFRKIRQNLLSEGKTTKYFKYALGEILLVVIGILIALQINNWNEVNKKDAEEREYLVNLLSEFEANQEELKRINSYHRFVKLKTKELSDLINPDPKQISLSKLDTLMWAVAFIPEFKALNAMISSEKLETINDYQLKNEIANWRLTYELYSYSLKLTYDQFNSHIYPFLTKNYQSKNFKHSILKDDQSYFPVNQKSILSNPVFENQIKIRNINAEMIFQRATKLIDIQQSIINDIERKLEK
ncbi:DUF6090 family protein [Croceitalea marina]|uniref:DUF6090 family protein n=1 Tax=Croceitalea marina TaxID=1775166 RepID=A0ABW5MY15_9FLAO